MSFLDDLRSALAANGIRGALADRIVAELADHLACDPGAKLGTPSEIAERFAAELRIVRTRRATLGAFAALALCGALVLVAGVSMPAHASPLAGLGILAFGQIAFVAGTLAVLRSLRGRSSGDFRLAQRRALVALAAGAVVCLCLAAGGSPFALLVLPALGAAAVASRRARALTPAAPAAGLRVDVPVPLPLLGAVAVALVLAQGIVGERSLSEGLLRAALEAAGLAAGALVLGRPLRLRN